MNTDIYIGEYHVQVSRWIGGSWFCPILVLGSNHTFQWICLIAIFPPNLTKTHCDLANQAGQHMESNQVAEYWTILILD
jgi:hypothetical protein